MRQIEAYYVDTLLGRNREFCSTFEALLSAADHGAKSQQAPGLKWESVGSQRPKIGNEIRSAALAAALKKHQVEFSQGELAGFDVPYLSFHSFINVSDTFFRPVEQVKEDRESRELRISSEHLLFEDTIAPLAARAKMKLNLANGAKQSRRIVFGGRSPPTNFLDGTKGTIPGEQRPAVSRACAVQ